MTAVLLEARAELRSRLRPWLVLALLIGLGSGAVMAAASGGRRTDSAYSRFTRARLGADLVVYPPFSPTDAKINFDDVERLPRGGRRRPAETPAHPGT